MKRVIRVFIAFCFLAGAVIVTPGELHSQQAGNRNRMKQHQVYKQASRKAERNGPSAMHIQKVFHLKVWINSEEDQKIVKEIGLLCQGKAECACLATEAQLDKLRREAIQFEVQHEGLMIGKVGRGKGWVEDYNDEDLEILDDDGWVYSPIPISTAPAGAIVTSLDVRCDIIHPNVGDLVVDLTDEDLTYEVRLWNRQGGSQDDIHVDTMGITTFNGELVNQTWYLWAIDCAPGNVGYIDCWDVTIWYEVASPDLIVQNLTATDYNPNVGENIDVTMVIKNQGDAAASSFWNGLFYDLTAPPDIETFEDRCLLAYSLNPGETDTLTFSDVTSYDPGIWDTYVLTDCDGEVVENDESNNYKGPITINWVESLPDLIVQSLAVDDYSLVITEHTNGSITIKNQGSGPVMDCFYTDVFKNRPSAPSPPATGEYFWEFCWLDPGETICYDFYKLPHSTSSGNWEMWGLVDSWPNTWGNVQESNENNNAYGPVNISWLDPPSPHDVTRTEITDRALEFLNVSWTCSESNATPHLSCPDDWRCRFTPGENYTGQAYSWGGWDKPDDFLTYLSVGLRAGAVPDSVDSLCGQADPYWATGVDCAGMVSRCWETNARKDCNGLAYVSDQIPVTALQPGDIMNRTGARAHVRMFYEWETPMSRMTVIEATPDQCTQSEYDTFTILNAGYVPRRYKHVIDPTNHDPVIDGHIHCMYPQAECDECIKLGQELTIAISASDQDDDPIYYEWISYWGFFIVDEETTYTVTTADSFVTYLAPIDPWWPEDELWVYVYDNRGGSCWTYSEFEAFDTACSCKCGDPNDDGVVNVGDPVYIVTYLFKGGPEPVAPIERADASNNCVVDIGDIVYLVAYLYQGGPAPECCWFSPE